MMNDDFKYTKIHRFIKEESEVPSFLPLILPIPPIEREMRADNQE